MIFLFGTSQSLDFLFTVFMGPRTTALWQPFIHAPTVPELWNRLLNLYLQWLIMRDLNVIGVT